MKNFATLVLKSGRDRAVLNRHPWIFSGAVKEMPTAENGEIIAVTDNHKKLLGYGFFSPNSQIVCRFFHFTNTPVEDFDEHFWETKIQDAYLLRKKLVIDANTNSYRLLHAEGDFISGIIVDIYDSVAVVQLLIKGTERIYLALIQAIRNLGINYIYLKTKQNSQFLENISISEGWLGEKPIAQILAKENGFIFPIDVEKGQKTGFFIDQRDNRALLKHYSKGKKVLNAFSYTGGFSVYALAGGATEVQSVDISKDAIAVCEESIKLNFSNANHTGIAADCFDFLRKNEELYDIIVLDPPAFAKSAKHVANASRGYKDLNLLGLKKLNKGGLLFTFSCSGNIDKELFRKIVFSAAADAGRDVRILHQVSQAIDHPINIFHPEGEYLKGLVLYVS